MVLSDKPRYGRILDRLLSGLKPEDFQKAIRILEWIACSFRLMKAHEIQDGIVLHMRDTELNELSKLRDGTFLALCKPLIELNAKNNTVDFVHFSAKEFVVPASAMIFANANTDSSCGGQAEPFDQTGQETLFFIIPRHITILRLVV
jgi:hypothetical protein